MTGVPNLPQSNMAEIEEAHRVLREHYGDEVRPIKEVCGGIFRWLDAIKAEHYTDSDDQALSTIARSYAAAGFVTITAAKSNLLYRLLYLRQPLRTEKCPVHDGHWAGYPSIIGGESSTACACQVGLDITGWLP